MVEHVADVILSHPLVSSPSSANDPSLSSTLVTQSFSQRHVLSRHIPSRNILLLIPLTIFAAVPSFQFIAFFPAYILLFALHPRRPTYELKRFSLPPWHPFIACRQDPSNRRPILSSLPCPSGNPLVRPFSSLPASQTVLFSLVHSPSC
jgi:hypothetical protein